MKTSPYSSNGSLMTKEEGALASFPHPNPCELQTAQENLLTNESKCRQKCASHFTAAPMQCTNNMLESCLCVPKRRSGSKSPKGICAGPCGHSVFFTGTWTIVREILWCHRPRCSQLPSASCSSGLLLRLGVDSFGLRDFRSRREPRSRSLQFLETTRMVFPSFLPESRVPFLSL